MYVDEWLINFLKVIPEITTQLEIKLQAFDRSAVIIVCSPSSS